MLDETKKLISETITSREEFSLEVMNILESNDEKIKKKLDIKAITKIDAIDILEYLSYIIIIEIKCKMYINELNSLCVDKCINKDRIPNQNCFASETIKYSIDLLTEYLLKGNKSYKHILNTIFKTHEEIDKDVLAIIIKDYIYCENILNLLSIKLGYSTYYSRIETSNILLEDNIFNIINDYRIKKHLNSDLILDMIKKIKSNIKSKDGILTTDDIIMIISSFLLVSSELFRFKDDHDNISSIILFKNNLKEVIQYA